MGISFLFYWPSWLTAVFIFFLIILCMQLGRVYRRYEQKKNAVKETAELGSLENLMLGLLGLLLAFTFGMALEKFADRRRIIIQEANAIGTAILRTDLYPDSVRSAMRKDFQQYVEVRIAYYDAGIDRAKILLALERSNYYSSRIWKLVAALSHDLNNRVRTDHMVPAMNDVIDIVTTREESRVAKVPPPILLVLLVMIAIGSFLVGYDPKEKKKILVFSFAFISCLTLYLILELDHPRRGLINLDSAENAMLQLRNMFIGQ